MRRLSLLVWSGLFLAACGDAQTQFPTKGPDPEPQILVDQFGYLPDRPKIAIFRPETFNGAGYISAASGLRPVVRNAVTGEIIYRAEAAHQTPNGRDSLSGDDVWWFDFTEVDAAGRYVVEDETSGVQSDIFAIGDGIYEPVRKTALKTFYYQRAGVSKQPPFADPAWADGASHLQDRKARPYSAPNDPSAEQDLSGGWYDAGDYNQYTIWTARAAKVLLHAYLENPSAWTDDAGIPESGNGQADILDEALWGLSWLEKMQQPDGRVLSILGRDVASPPSAARGPSAYGEASTASSLAAAGAFALAAHVFAETDTAVSARMKARAERALSWATAHPNIEFRNNDPAFGTEGLGAGQQEPNESGRQALLLTAHLYLDLIGSDLVGPNAVTPDMRARLAQVKGTPYELPIISALKLHRTSLQGAGKLSEFVLRAYRNSFMASPGSEMKTPYFIRSTPSFNDIHWGSNGVVAKQGVLDHLRLAPSPETYLHYLHGVNPNAIVYLSNASDLGAERSASEIYHAWFPKGDAKWGRAGVSLHGPLPGFLVGGPNAYYALNPCCPNSCGRSDANARCRLDGPPLDQPPLRSYRDFSDGWPRDSWQVSEPSISYQADYLRLLGFYAD